MEISWATLWRVFFLVLLGAVLFYTREVLIVLFLAIIISAAFDGPVSFLERKRIPRIFGTLSVFILVLAAISLILYTVIPLSFVELQELLNKLSKLKLPVFGPLKFDTSFLIQKMIKSLGDLTNALFSGDISVFAVIAKIFGNIITVITTIVLSFYLTVSRAGVENFLRAVLPLSYEEYVVEVYLRVRRKLGKWLQGQLVLMSIMGAAVWLGLWAMGIKYNLVLGILAGLLEIVPIAGPIFTGIIGFVIASSQSWALGFYSLILFFVLQQVENHFFVPVVMRRTIGISPVVIVVAILAGSELAGALGIILAVPVAVVFQEIVSDWEKRKLRVRDSKPEL